MSNVRVCTLMWGSAWDSYGKAFAESFTKYWEDGIEIVLVTDQPRPFDRAFQLVLSSIQGYSEFIQKWEASNIKVPVPTTADNITGWKHNAVKWAPQALTPAAVLRSRKNWIDGDIFVWLDADVETTNCVTSSWVEDKLGGHDIACLRRNNTHTEIGFYAMRLNAQTRSILNRFADLYTSFDILKHKEWHSAYAWDIAVAENQFVSINNLSFPNSPNHVFPHSVLASALVHHKGNRKPGGG